MRSPKTQQAKVNLETADSLGAFCASDAFVPSSHQLPGLCGDWDSPHTSGSATPLPSFRCSLSEALPAPLFGGRSQARIQLGRYLLWVIRSRATFTPSPVSCFAGFPGWWCLPWKPWIAQSVGERVCQALMACSFCWRRGTGTWLSPLEHETGFRASFH